MAKIYTTKYFEYKKAVKENYLCTKYYKDLLKDYQSKFYILDNTINGIVYSILRQLKIIDIKNTLKNLETDKQLIRKQYEGIRIYDKND